MEKKIKDSLRNISKKLELDYLILFGSRITVNFNKNSDYDLAFFKKNISIDEEITLRDELYNLFKDQKFDLINLEKDHSYFLLRKIYSGGKIIFLKNKKVFQIEEEKSFFNYIDSKELLEPTKKAYLANL